VSYLSHQYLLSPLLIPLPPTSTLFPYTTLFRSVFFAIIACRCSLAESRRLQGLLQQVFGLFNRHVDASGDEALAHEPFFVDNGRSEEHTLNSSHVSISYAVFCLKKKRRTVTFVC